ncbi:uncharacterized protein RAG0_09092 [Rhynchosporium agropyri]|uniref:CPAF-like PDZ domain-containing protein n=1 Tax=Rhynchosporium agropyri TaxID=914238 RepID=A0A1E1KTT2_9HELO|nr:uncharacterized protein RAG0_09092 [Rhynchosporium agropyri]
MLGLPLIVLAGALGIPLANAHPSALNERRQTTPCGEIRNKVKAAFQADPGARPLLPAQLGYDCLMSVPLHKENAIAFIDSYIPYVQWQSTLADLKSPPSSYSYAAVDVLQELAQIRQKLQTDKYTSEYSYMTDFYKVIGSAHDAFLTAIPDILGNAITFYRPQHLALVSYVEEGCQLPKIYIRDEVKTNPKSSAVKVINGMPAAAYIDKLVAKSSGYPDHDAGYNSYMYSVAGEASGNELGEFQGLGAGAMIFEGPTTTLTFENGTTRTYDNYARIRDSFAGVTDGQSFYNRFCTGKELKETASIHAVDIPRRHAYPKQMTDTSEDSIVGYYMDAPGYTNIAVLSVLDWDPKEVKAFQAIAEKFLARAKADKKKIIVDLSSSTDGSYFLAYDLFKQFFPPLSILDYNRIRENEGFNTMTQIGSGPHFAHYNAKTATPDEVAIAESVYNYQHFEINIKNQNFPSYQAKYGPILHKGDNFTDIMRFNLSNPRISSATDGFGLQITGLGSRSNFKIPPFAASDIVLLHDGMCSSPCPIFATNMAQQAKVKTVVIGGRPTLTSMQGIGGTTGPEGTDIGTILSSAQTIMQFATTKEQRASLKKFTQTALDRLPSNGFSSRDVIKPSQLGTGPDKGVGSNFIREEADCRLFYTKAMTYDPREAWKAAADVAWNGKKCAVGK